MRLIDADALIEFCAERWIPLNIDAVNMQPTIQPEPKWIPVERELPEVGQNVIAQCRAGIIKTLKLDSDGDWYQDAEHCYLSGFVVAWMPLPKPFEGGIK